jgi:hypothetical protein
MLFESLKRSELVVLERRSFSLEIYFSNIYFIMYINPCSTFISVLALVKKYFIPTDLQNSAISSSSTTFSYSTSQTISALFAKITL